MKITVTIISDINIEFITLTLQPKVPLAKGKLEEEESQA
jgi:hypothetical protein